jgi:hypothetical protein
LLLSNAIEYHSSFLVHVVLLINIFEETDYFRYKYIGEIGRLE